MMVRWAIGFLVRVFITSLGLSVAGVAYGQTLVVQPLDGMSDERLIIKISNLKPRQPIIIRATSQDADGRLWQSFAGFYADRRGIVDLAAQAPANGTYNGVDAMGLIRSMNVSGADHNRVRLTHKRADPVSFRFSLEVAGKTVASTEVVRRFMKVDSRMTDVRDGGLVGTLFTPATDGPFPGVIVLGGSEGGLSSEDAAGLLASHGYAALALAYFGTKELPQQLEEIPLEYFKQAIDWMMQQPSTRHSGLALLGNSKGAEAALLIASRHKEVRAVVGYVPSGVVWSCICESSNKSSWSSQGRPVRFLPVVPDPTYNPPEGFPIAYAINYTYSLKDRVAVEQATIPVERINGPILLISASDDQLWPSSALAEMIMERLRRKRHAFPDQHVTYKRAGHLIGKAYLPAGSTLVAGGQLETGGTPEGNARAQSDSWPRVLKFLERVFSAGQPDQERGSKPK